MLTERKKTRELATVVIAKSYAAFHNSAFEPILSLQGGGLAELKAVSLLRREAQTRFEPGLIGPGMLNKERVALKARRT